MGRGHRGSGGGGHGKQGHSFMRSNKSKSKKAARAAANSYLSTVYNRVLTPQQQGLGRDYDPEVEAARRRELLAPKPRVVDLAFRDPGAGTSVVIRTDVKRSFGRAAQEYVTKVGGGVKLEDLRFRIYVKRLGKVVRHAVLPQGFLDDLSHLGVHSTDYVEVTDLRRTGADKSLKLTVRDGEGGGEATFTVTPTTLIRDVLQSAMPIVYPYATSYKHITASYIGMVDPDKDTPCSLGMIDNETLDTLYRNYD